MKHLKIAAISLTSVSAPAVAERHCQAPRPEMPYFDVAKHGSDFNNQLQAFTLTHRDYLHAQHLRNVEICQSMGGDYDFHCDSPEYGEMGDINQDYLGLSEEEYEAKLEEHRLRTLDLRDALAACTGDG